MKKLWYRLKGYTDTLECYNFVDFDDEERSKGQFLVVLSKNPAIKNVEIKRKDIVWDTEEQLFRDYFVGTVEIRPLYGYIYLRIEGFVRKIISRF